MEKSDQQLLEQYKDGDINAMELLVEKYKRPLFAYLFKMTGNNRYSDEIFQETWLRVIKNIGKFEQQNFYGWLVRIAHNLLLDKIKKKKADYSLDADIGDGETPWVETIPAPDAAKNYNLDDEYLAERINNAIIQLPTEQREVFLLRTYNDLSFKEIAEAQKISINTALARMKYALEKLRKILKDEYYEL